jgi:hypothetical protein
VAEWLLPEPGAGRAGIVHGAASIDAPAGHGRRSPQQPATLRAPGDLMHRRQLLASSPALGVAMPLEVLERVINDWVKRS